MRKINKIFLKVLEVVMNISIIIFFLATVMTFVNVISRKFFSKPITGVEELDNIVLIMIVFLTIPYLEMKDRHLTLSVLYDNFSKKTKLIVNKLKRGVTVFISSLLSYSAWKVFIQNIEFKFSTPTLGIPLYIPYGILLIGFVLATIVNFLKIFESERV